MAERLFGLDIARLVATSIGPQLYRGVLQRQVPGVRTSPTSGHTSSPVSYGFRGFWDSFGLAEIDGSQVLFGDTKALIIVGTLPAGVMPQKSDTITIQGITRVVQGILERDPAGATYLVQCRDRTGPDGA
jgi:hypothetical protein